MRRFFQQQTLRAMAIGTITAMLVGVGFIAGVVSLLGIGPDVVLQLPTTELHATATDSNDKFVVATGIIEKEVEGVFFLDPLSGDLQCTVYNPRAQGFNSLFRRNVLGDLQLDQEKRPQFLMVTGQTSMGGGQVLTAGDPPGCIVYVVESSSGKFAAYAVPWRSLLFSRGHPQQGALVLLAVGNVRQAAVRE